MFKKLIVSHAFRRRTSWIIAGVLILPFAIFFSPLGQAPRKGPGGLAGILFGKKVAWESFEEERQWLRRQVAAQFGELPAPILEPLITRNAWDRLMLLEEAKRQRLRVSDQELAAFIQRVPQFQDEGRFRPDWYHQFLRTSQVTPRLFETRLRKDLLVQKLVDAVQGPVTVSEEDLRAAYQEAYEELRASLIVVDPGAFTQVAAGALTDDDLLSYYSAHREELASPEQVAFEFAGMSRDELAAQSSLTDEELGRFYDEHPERFMKEDGTLLPFEEAKESVRQHARDERARQQLIALAVDLEQDLAAKRPFDEIVAGRALIRGDAGPLPVGELWAPGVPAPELLQEVAGLSEGELSDVVESKAGVYVARVTQRLPSHVPSLEGARERVRGILVQERARQAAKTSADALRAKLLERQAAGESFEASAAAEGAQVTQAQFTRTSPVEAAGSAPGVNTVAFATPLGDLTQVIETPVGYVLLRPDVRIPADDSRFAEVEQTLRESLSKRRQDERLGAWMSELRSRANLQSFVEEGGQAG